MNSKLVATFLDIFESRNFKRTADRLNISQSSISGRIRALEAEVGTRLFERGRTGATPTPAGVRFEPHARLLLATWYQACSDTGGNQEQLLRLAGQFSLRRPVLVDWIAKIRAKDQSMAIDLRADYSLQIIKDLSMGAIDIGLLYSPQYLPDLDIKQVGEDHFVMVSTEGNSMSQIAQETYVNTNYTSHFSQRHQALLPELSSSPLSVSFEGLAVDFLRRTGGTTYVPMRMVEDLKVVFGNLNIVEDAPEISNAIYTAVHMRKRHNVKVVSALSLLQETLSLSA